MNTANKIKKLRGERDQSFLVEVSPRRLRNKALHYLGRYASTEYRLKQVLVKFIKKKWPKIPINDSLDHIQETVNWCKECKFLNDAEYAFMKVKSGRAKGYSTKQIKKRLALAGLSTELVESAFNEAENTVEAEFQAALTLAKKKRIGPYATSPISDPKERMRQMARLARAGYSYKICKNVFDYLEEL